MSGSVVSNLSGIPVCTRSDNGPQIIAKELRARLSRFGVKAAYITPACPAEHGFFKASMAP